MGMTDRQFETILQGFVRDLKRIELEYKEKSESPTLKELLKDYEQQLRRP